MTEAQMESPLVTMSCSSTSSSETSDDDHGTSWTRRSLIEDAKFETITNAEFAKQERRASLSTSSDTDNITINATQNEADAEDAFPLNGDVTGQNTGQRQCTLMLGLRDAGGLSRLFKHFENGRAFIKHVETRTSRKSSTSLELLLTFETAVDNIANVIKTVKTLSSVQDVILLNEKDTQNNKIPWFPKHVTDLDKCDHLLTKFNPDLHHEHPGFSDMEYRKRREMITENAFNYRYGQAIPRVEYTTEEITCWGTVFKTLSGMYEKHACAEYLANFRMLERECGWSENAIPQLEDVSQFMQRKSGFRLRPVAGLLSARDFLASLAFRVFQCTQYVRHPSKPEISVEPDCVHELLGHVPMLSDPEFAQFSQEIGLASLGASDEDIEKFATMYWFTVEFGLCKQNGELKVYGAAILSAYGEFLHALSDIPDKRVFEPSKVAVQEYDDQSYQDVYYVCDSFADMTEKVRTYARSIKRPYELRYDPYTQSIQVLDNKNIIHDTAKILRIELNSLNAALSRVQYLTVSTD